MLPFSIGFREHVRVTPINLIRESAARQRQLTVFAVGMVLCMIPVALVAQFDDRTIREVGVWAKPLKFMAATALFALTTAWCFGLLPNSVRKSSAGNWIVRTIILTSLFEVVYITIQASRGLGSHYNADSRFYFIMFGMMGAAAVMLTATQAVLGWLIWRHATSRQMTTHGVAVGLILTCVLSVASGMMLGANQPPAGAGMPLTGWILTGADLRPAHFVAVHAQQLIPAGTYGLHSLGVGYRGLSVFLTAYLGLWLTLTIRAI